MYLLEETDEARAMRAHVLQLLRSYDKENRALAMQLIEGGGFHEDFRELLSSVLTYTFIEDLENIRPFWYAHITSLHGKNVGTRLPDIIFKFPNLKRLSIRSKSTLYPENLAELTQLEHLEYAGGYHKHCPLPESWRTLTNLKLLE